MVTTQVAVFALTSLTNTVILNVSTILRKLAWLLSYLSNHLPGSKLSVWEHSRISETFKLERSNKRWLMKVRNLCRRAAETKWRADEQVDANFLHLSRYKKARKRAESVLVEVEKYWWQAPGSHTEVEEEARENNDGQPKNEPRLSTTGPSGILV